jgi:hypothetical protein
MRPLGVPAVHPKTERMCLSIIQRPKGFAFWDLSSLKMMMMMIDVTVTAYCYGRIIRIVTNE